MTHLELTPEVTKSVCEGLTLCMTRGDAARLAGIPPATFQDWMARGEAGEEPFAAFRQEVSKAELQAQRRLLANVSMAAASDARHAEWLLSRRWARDWGDRERSEIPHRRSARKAPKRGGSR